MTIHFAGFPPFPGKRPVIRRAFFFMPSKSKKQAKFMAACSHGAGYKSCPPAKVAHEFNQADKGTGILRSKPMRGVLMGKRGR